MNNLIDEPEENTIVKTLESIRSELSDETKKAMDDLKKREWDYEFHTHLHHWTLLLCFEWRWSRNQFYAGELSSIFKKPAIWIWRNLSGGEAPFYQGAGLKSYVAPIPPSDQDWHGWKYWLWYKAVEHLIETRYLTHTPTLRVKF